MDKVDIWGSFDDTPPDWTIELARIPLILVAKSAVFGHFAERGFAAEKKV